MSVSVSLHFYFQMEASWMGAYPYALIIPHDSPQLLDLSPKFKDRITMHHPDAVPFPAAQPFTVFCFFSTYST